MMRSGAERSSATTSATVTQSAHGSFIARRASKDSFIAPTRQTAAPAVQAKMEVNKPGDKFEQEADRIAEKVVRMPAPPRAGKDDRLQRQPQEKLQKKDEERILKAAAPEEKPQKKDEDKRQKAAAPEEKLQKKEEDKLQKAAAPEEKLQRDGGDGAPAVSSDTQSAIRNK